MRSRLSFGISVIAIAAGCLSQMTVPVLAQDSASVLPGARPTIAAAKFTSLQAAFDAVPEGGGLVRLPAGTFEITEPLRVHSEDTCVEGAGTATHIKNLNVDGQPALLVSHLECVDAKTDRKHQLWR